MELTTAPQVAALGASRSQLERAIKEQSIWRSQDDHLTFGTMINLEPANKLLNSFLKENEIRFKKGRRRTQIDIRLKNMNVFLKSNNHLEIDALIEGKVADKNIPSNTKIKGSVIPDALIFKKEKIKDHVFVNCMIDLHKVDWIDLEIVGYDIPLKVFTIFYDRYHLLTTFSFPTKINGIKIPVPDISSFFVEPVRYSSAGRLFIGLTNHEGKAESFSHEKQTLISLLSSQSIFNSTLVSNDFLLTSLLDFSNQLLKKHIKSSKPLLKLSNIDSKFGKVQTILQKDDNVKASIEIAKDHILLNDFQVSIGFKNNQELYGRFIVEVDGKELGLDIKTLSIGATASVKMDKTSLLNPPKIEIHVDFVHAKMKHWYDFVLKLVIQEIIGLALTFIFHKINKKIEHIITDKYVMPSFIAHHIRLNSFSSLVSSNDVSIRTSFAKLG